MPFLGSPSTPSKPLRKITPSLFWGDLVPRASLSALYPRAKAKTPTLIPVVSFGMGRFFGAFVQTPTLVFINFLGKLPRLAMSQADPGKP
jgi:hypothetical protein